MSRLRPLQEIAQEYEVSRATLHRLIKKGEVARYRRGGDRRTFLDEEEVRKALGFRRIDPPAGQED